jgi:hypothetical protein
MNKIIHNISSFESFTEKVLGPDIVDMLTKGFKSAFQGDVPKTILDIPLNEPVTL